MIGRFVGRCLRALGFQEPVQFLSHAQVEHPNQEMQYPGELVIVRDGQIDKWVCFKCPCGCGEKVQLSLSKARRPRWKAETDWFGRPSLKPSIRQNAGCNAHFWIRKGKVEWCADSPVRN